MGRAAEYLAHAQAVYHLLQKQRSGGIVEAMAGTDPQSLSVALAVGPAGAGAGQVVVSSTVGVMVAASIDSGSGRPLAQPARVSGGGFSQRFTSLDTRA